MDDSEILLMLERNPPLRDAVIGVLKGSHELSRHGWGQIVLEINYADKMLDTHECKVAKKWKRVKNGNGGK